VRSKPIWKSVAILRCLVVAPLLSFFSLRARVSTKKSKIEHRLSPIERPTCASRANGSNSPPKTVLPHIRPLDTISRHRGVI